MNIPLSDIKLIGAAETYGLRQRVLRPNQGLDECQFPGDDATSTFHFAAFKSKEIVGIASLYEESHPDLMSDGAWRIRGMATDASVRGLGYGRRLLESCLTQARSQGADLVWCNARSTAIGFYQQLGFSTVGEAFELPGIGAHYLMVIAISE